MIEPNIIFLILFFSLIIAAPSTADRIDKFVTKHRKHGVQLPADEDANKSFPRSALVPGVIVALAGLGLEVNCACIRQHQQLLLTSSTSPSIRIRSIWRLPSV